MGNTCIWFRWSEFAHVLPTEGSTFEMGQYSSSNGYEHIQWIPS